MSPEAYKILGETGNFIQLTLFFSTSIEIG